jgi:3-hydroxyisobutyrate dehydrogenase-like beta-hydroxyacid dehydrogenase
VRVGFIGLGAMGLPMATRLGEQGHTLVTMVHRDRTRASALEAYGTSVVETPADVARDSEVVITILPADRELRAVAIGPGGLVEAMRPGQSLIDMTTATPATLADVADTLRPLGVDVLDAPVSGGTTAAAAGTLTIMVGGESPTLEQCRPLLEAMGTIVHVGGLGQGKVVKLVNQALAAVHLLAIGEAFALGVRCGARPETLYEVIKTSSGASRMMDLRLPGFLLTGNAQPGFRLDLMKKDINLAVDSARAHDVAVPLTAAASQLFAAASAAGHGDDDFSRAAAFVARLAGVRLED